MEKARDTDTAKINVGSIHDCNNPHSCGYCSKSTGSMSWGFTAKKLPAGYYERLMNRGWRRCGSYYYKMNMEKTCCPCFTIKSDVNEFKIKKQQKKVVRNIIDLFGNKERKEVKKEEGKKVVQEKSGEGKVKEGKQKQGLGEGELEELTKIITQTHQSISSNPQRLYQSLEEKPSSDLNFDVLEGLRFFKSQKDKDGHKKGDYSTNYIMLLFGKNKKLFKTLTLPNFVAQVSTLVRETLFKVSEKFSYNIQYSGYLVFISAYKPTKQVSEEFQVIPTTPVSEQKPKIRIHKHISQQFTQILQSPNPNEGKSKPKKDMVEEKEIVEWPELIMTPQKIIFGRLQIHIVPVQQDVTSFQMYSKYNKNIHDKEKESMSGYTGFLCVDALDRSTTTRDVAETRYHPSWDEKGEHQNIVCAGKVRKNLGCFHMKYYLNERLIGVGVIDVVEEGLSSVYFFYDHTYKEYRLGVFSTLMEIEYIRYISKAFSEFKNYYLGFYIHNCQKMNYKADYQPCLLLCPITYTYQPVTPQLRQKLDQIVAKKAKVRLSTPTEPINPEMEIKSDIGQFIDKHLKLSYMGKKITLKDFEMKYFLQVLMNLKIFVQEAGGDLFQRTQFEI